ncbi:MAG: 23S rRNA (pseudouridine(1915)-N(3))-methyltransferase RlmH [Xanthomonadales bacterium]|nr:23S rRNA (pseudouridine(1915)-N(3))-methyltransferase RlmH [Xanthomonadales bacterium]
MRLLVAAIGQKMPAWVDQGVMEYQKRFPRHLDFKIRALPLPSRQTGQTLERLQHKETESLLKASAGCYRIALDENGKQWTTRKLAGQLEGWQMQGEDIAFLIGGPDGLSSDCLQSCRQKWSLGLLTMPHPLVRVMLAEQLYRAWTITTNHPYHRE